MNHSISLLAITLLLACSPAGLPDTSDDLDPPLPDYTADEVCNEPSLSVPGIWAAGFGSSPADGEFLSWADNDEAIFLLEELGEEVEFFAPVDDEDEFPDLDALGLLEVWAESGGFEYGMAGDFSAATPGGDLLLQVGYSSEQHDDGVRFSATVLQDDTCPVVASDECRTEVQKRPVRFTRGDVVVDLWEGSRVEADGYVFRVGAARHFSGDWLDECGSTELRYAIVAAEP